MASTVLTGPRRSNAPGLPDNRLHYIRDTAWREDACRASTGNGPRNLATIRNLALSLLRLHGVRKVKETLEHIAGDRHRALQFMVT